MTQPESTVPARIDRTTATTDLQALQTILEERFAYLHASKFGQGLPELLTQLQATLPEQQSVTDWAATIQGLLSRSLDGHARVREFKPISGAIPALFHVAGNDVVAVKLDRSDFLLPGCPFLKAIDGRPVSEWLPVVGSLVAGEGASWRRERTVSGLLWLQQWRRKLKLPETPEATLTLQGVAGTRNLVVTLIPDKPDYGVWPAPGSRWLGQVGYLRLPAMSPRAAQEIQQWLPEFQSAQGLIVDLRGNSGGMREAFLPLLRALQPGGAGPRVVNVACSRQSNTESATRMAGRGLFPEGSDHWTAQEKAVIEQFKPSFKPNWTPPPGQFGDWHFMLVHPAGPAEPAATCPVVILTDGMCFSATDIFLCGVKGLPNVTIMGESSGGGSGSAMTYVLPSGVQFRVASMASFKPSGELLEGHGTPVDIQVVPSPESFLRDGQDSVLQRALSLLTA